MLTFEGDREFTLLPADLWAKLTDARFLVQCIPDVDKVSTCEADHATLVLRPSFAFVRGTLDMDMHIVDPVVPSSARVHVHSKGIGSSSTVEATLAFSPTAAGTRVHWSAEIKELGGLLKMIPQGLIRGAAQKVINDAWNLIDAKLNAPPVP
jgi:carbon monoxide dehydrogenase subunit G